MKKIWRKIHFSEEEIWRYIISRDVIIRSPYNKKIIVRCPEFFNYFNVDFEEHKDPLAITPGMIKVYIQNNLREDINK
jgi:hypothetical protein